VIDFPTALNPEPHTPTSDDIRRELERVLASAGFANAERMSRFLKYVVEQALAGASDQVKEYVIGVEVFQRDQQYDPRLDSIVRVEAKRLRTKLDEYYAGPGREDDVVIRIPRGSYVPLFEQRRLDTPPLPPATEERPVEVPQVSPRRRTTWQIGLGLAAVTIALVALAARGTGLWATDGAPPLATIAVLPFAQYSVDSADALLAAKLTDGVSSELARIKTIGVISRTSTAQFAAERRPLRDIAQTLHADLVMEATLHHDGGTVRVDARLVNAATDRKFWVQDFTAPTSDVGSLPKRIAAGVATAVREGRR
jgi:adenylate cyclase